jgi:hypothetical protein
VTNDWDGRSSPRPGPAGGVPGRADDHCKTSDDMLSLRCPDKVLPRQAVSLSRPPEYVSPAPGCTRPSARYPPLTHGPASTPDARYPPLTGEHSQSHLSVWDVPGCVGISDRTTHGAHEPFPERRSPSTSGRISRIRQEDTAPGSPGRGATCLLTRRQHKSVVDTSFDGEHGARSIEQNALRIGSQDQLADRSAPAQTDHDEVCIDLIGHLDQVL